MICRPPEPLLEKWRAESIQALLQPETSTPTLRQLAINFLKRWGLK